MLIPEIRKRIIGSYCPFPHNYSFLQIFFSLRISAPHANNSIG